ncbi:MAG TPA: carboxylating nicotinate-nucleotide diphosphorylase [Thermoleophilaceae bacterium]|nr:carboxylating nicotinate-nucleotide diphosphorylase [Thermoleophilaceae bacterium]
MSEAPQRSLLDAIDRALEEDLGSGDLTSAAVVPEGALAQARIEQRAPGVLAGLRVAQAVFGRVDPLLRWQALAPEGEWLEPAPVAEITGAAAAIMAGERVALNFLGRLSGVATLTARYVSAVEGTGAVILDTRKTTPGLRALEKEAVRLGGGTNHRQGLFDAILVKENHSLLAGGVGKATCLALEHAPEGVAVEVECATLGEVEEALGAGAGRLLLDNMEPTELRRAVELAGGRAELEASGGIDLETVREVAETGVDYISVGALTHSAPALDVSLLLTQ